MGHIYWNDSARLFDSGETVDVLALGEVDVKEVIGRRQPARRPPPNVFVEPAVEVGAVLEEVLRGLIRTVDRAVDCEALRC